jgi:phosphate transport system protein
MPTPPAKWQRQEHRRADRKVNELEKAIDDDCAHIIAKRQPAASDLRLVLGISKIVTDLERAGDEAKKIAKGVRRIYESGQCRRSTALASAISPKPPSPWCARRSMPLPASIPNRRRSVIRADSEVDTEFKSIIRQLITHMMEDPRTITTSIDIIWIARAIERIGDHAKNISEQVVFVVEGRDIRHTQGGGQVTPDHSGR